MAAKQNLPALLATVAHAILNLMLSPTFKGAHFWVTNMAASAAFYRAIGLPVPEDAGEQAFFRIELGDGMNLEFGSLALTRAYHADFVPPQGRGATCLQFGLQSREAVDSLHQQMTAAGYASNLAPVDAFWGARYAELLDPDGNAVGFHSPRDPNRGGEPALG